MRLAEIAGHQAPGLVAGAQILQAAGLLEVRRKLDRISELCDVGDMVQLALVVDFCTPNAFAATMHPATLSHLAKDILLNFVVSLVAPCVQALC